jgi:uncharacterized protein
VSVELRPLGVACNIQCQYCYQNPQRDAGNLKRSYDMERMKAAIEREGGPFTMFGGEPLLVPEDDLEELWRWGLERFGGNAIQTNGVLINDRHVQMFKDYKVSVGMSIDGPGELNDVRWVGTLERTREATAKTEAAIERLCAEGIVPGLIVTLHRGNAIDERLPRLVDWFLKLERIGITAARLHILEVDDKQVGARYALTPAENLTAFLAFYELERQLTTLELDTFSEMRSLLLGDDNQTGCVWNSCDPYTTSAVRGVEGSGRASNCGRTNKDGIDFVKSQVQGFERYLALYHTPQEHDGCNGCRFFLMCKGQCPGTAVDGDWRNRTEHCEVWMSLFERLEHELVEAGRKPLSLSADRARLEHGFLELWSGGQTTTIAGLARALDERDAAVASGAAKGTPLTAAEGDIVGDSA